MICFDTRRWILVLVPAVLLFFNGDDEEEDNVGRNI
jgi:hypothetical protein